MAVKPALHENTIAKISVVSSANTEALAEMLGGLHRLPTFLGGTDSDCRIGHREVVEWQVVGAGACHKETLRVPATSADGARQAVVCFRSRSFGARVAVFRRAAGGEGERASVKELQLYRSHACPQRLAVPLGAEPYVLEIDPASLSALTTPSPRAAGRAGSIGTLLRAVPAHLPLEIENPAVSDLFLVMRDDDDRAQGLVRLEVGVEGRKVPVLPKGGARG